MIELVELICMSIFWPFSPWLANPTLPFLPCLANLVLATRSCKSSLANLPFHSIFLRITLSPNLKSPLRHPILEATHFFINPARAFVGEPTCFFLLFQHTGAKILILSKNHMLKFSIFPKFTISKSHRIHIFKISFSTKFTFSKSQFWQNSHF